MIKKFIILTMISLGGSLYADTTGTITLKNGKVYKNAKFLYKSDSVIADFECGKRIVFKQNEISEVQMGTIQWKTKEECNLSKEVAKNKTFKNSIGMEFVLIPAGEFMMGCSDGDTECSEDEKPAHKVKITKPFYMGKYEVTQGQWKTVMENKPSKFKDCGENCPVETVSWNDVQEFIKKLNDTSTSLGDRSVQYRLPTEAEWEYAARGTSSVTTTLLTKRMTMKYYWGNEINGDFLWYDGNSESKTHPIGQKKPNEFGLYDMLGNVWEWTNDWYDKDYYSKSKVNDPSGSKSGFRRVYRGNSWYGNLVDCRLSSRSGWGTGNWDSLIGFRLVVSGSE